jgi:hypothetical protein
MLDDRMKDLILASPEARQALIDRSPWYFHDTSIDAIKSIRVAKLNAKDPGAIDPDVLALVDATLGTRAMVCFKPVGSPLYGSSGGKQGRLALPSSLLPEKVGVDWSNTAYAFYLPKIPLHTPPIDTFLRLVKDMDGFSAYADFKPSDLRVCIEGQPLDDPTTWPLLTNADVSKIAVINPNAI